MIKYQINNDYRITIPYKKENNQLIGGFYSLKNSGSTFNFEDSSIYNKNLLMFETLWDLSYNRTATIPSREVYLNQLTYNLKTLTDNLKYKYFINVFDFMDSEFIQNYFTLNSWLYRILESAINTLNTARYLDLDDVWKFRNDSLKFDVIINYKFDLISEENKMLINRNNKTSISITKTPNKVRFIKNYKIGDTTYFFKADVTGTFDGDRPSSTISQTFLI